jgi:penicillin-binding protein 2
MLQNRRYFFYFLFAVTGIVFAVRLFYIQILDDQYKLSAENNVVRIIREFPPRGMVYDRNGKLLVANQVAYDLMVVPQQVKGLDTSSLAFLLEISTDELRGRLKRSRSYSRYKPTAVSRQLMGKMLTHLQEELFRFPGFFIQKRTLRTYPYPLAANVVGSVGEVNEAFIKRNPKYQMGDLVGVSGLEKSYETELRGEAGVKRIMVDVHNREKGSFAQGSYDTAAVPGAVITSTLDFDLQVYGEQLMQGKRGSIVAIEPATGEILALVTSPNFDPNLLVGQQRGNAYAQLLADSISKPLYDRALLAEYPPGSPFKLVNALIGLQTGAITPQSAFSCHHGFHFGSLTVACHCSGGTMALEEGIYKSCNNYFCTTYKRIIEAFPSAHEGMDQWSKMVKSFGLGQYLNNDLPTGRKGFVPDADYFDRAFGNTYWRAVSTISMGIGQGELVVTPVQLANVAAIIGNRGWYITPHIVKEINNQPHPNPRFREKQYTLVDSVHFPVVVEGMYQVFERGTAAGSKLPGLTMCGKTGTAENPHGQDHSIFLAFAPKDNPKIAIAIFVENGYWGSRWAAPIASLMMEKYITQQVTRPALEKRMIEGSLEAEYQRQLTNPGPLKKKK